MTLTAHRAQFAEARAARELAALPAWIWDGRSLPVPIEAIVEDHYGLLVEMHHSLEDFENRTDVHVSGVLLRRRGRILVDALEASRAPGRKRFTLAHELGHLVLHGDEGQPRQRIARVAMSSSDIDRRQVGAPLPAALHYPPAELEANQFAAAMLMPARLVAPLAELTPSVIAESFGVSNAAAQKRLDYLRGHDSQPLLGEARHPVKALREKRCART